MYCNASSFSLYFYTYIFLIQILFQAYQLKLLKLSAKNEGGFLECGHLSLLHHVSTVNGLGSDQTRVKCGRRPWTANWKKMRTFICGLAEEICSIF